MLETEFAYSKRLLTNCKQKRRLYLFILIVTTYLLRDKIWDALNPNCSKLRPAGISIGETARRKLILLQVLFRHGHHTPFFFYPNDPIPESYWIEGLGELTKLGKRQHYLMGIYLRSIYEDYLSHNVQEIDCMSSMARRALMGADAFLAGFYPAPPGKRMAEDLPYQPIPCHGTKYLQSSPNCSASSVEKVSIRKTKEAVEFMKGYQEFYQNWTDYSGLQIRNYCASLALYKTLLAEKTINLTIPSWAEDTWESLRENADICYHFDFKTRLLHRLRAGPIIGEIVGKMRSKIQNPKWKLKTCVYSGHGSNVAAILNALGLFNFRYPPYASTILFELYEEVEGGHTVRLLLTNATEPEKSIPPPYVLQLSGCGKYCPLEELERRTTDLFPLDWEKECVAEDPNETTQP